MNPHDLTRLSVALEYVDLGAGLYLCGGSDYAARLLAAAAEQLLGDLVKLVEGPQAVENAQELLERVARAYQAKARSPRAAAPRGMDTQGRPDALRAETEAYLRACWFMLEAMGLSSLAPSALSEAVETTTVFSGQVEPFC